MCWDEIEINNFRREGVNIRYRFFKGDDSADPLVFVHGWAGSQDDWMSLFEDNCQRGITCLAYDAPGFGISQFDSKAESQRADFSIERYMGDLLALLDHLKLQRIRLVGHSWGGVVAMRFAARYPDRVSGLVVIGGAYYDPHNWIHLIFKWISWVMVWLIIAVKPLLRRYKRARKFAVRRYTYRPLAEHEAEVVMNDVICSDNRTLEKTLWSGYTVKFKEVCPAITSPTLYVSGKYDQVAPPMFVKPFVDMTPGSHYAELAKCGHFPMQEVPELLIETLNSFWEKTS
ncbi:MAG: alpha/beta hydrolase [Chloroflexi bacterium]|uniref:Alpha/beta hydrolase n=1 Tax=Candidatus Chlorohelix allophototropha TaxID=3003348 RepID=A0A8T7M727_9CHLR|nr:alpha/beta hydrolase [Chloroflexota bacterium]WJW69731.1 alpha/beta hydrolase [Chloroflexota bacterium L227-S17]